MVSTVTARPNHYETLGLKPTASRDEIEQAFTQHLFRPRAFGGLTQISIAYETLRDPAKRRAYDDLIGVKPEPLPPTTRPQEVQFSGSAQFLLSAFVASGAARADTPPALVAPRRQPEPTAESKSEYLATEPLRDPDAEPMSVLDQPMFGDHSLSRPEPEEGPVRWKRAAAILGIPVVAVALAGAWVGSVIGNNAAEAGPPEQALTVPLPRAKPQPAQDESAALEWSATGAEATRRRNVALASRRVERAPAQQKQRALSEQQLEQLAPLDVGLGTSQFPDNATALVATQPAAAQPPAVSLPLPSSTIARTLHRAGYGCGQVASTAAVEGEGSGVFKVTCTSGQSYRAAPVRGRYYFRRWKG